MAMRELVNFFEALFAAIPFGFLEIWGRVGYLVGAALMLAAFGRFTFRPAGRWGFGRERQTWSSTALISMMLTAVLIISTGYIGSFIVLVPGAQTFESLKDVSVFLCILLFGYPALVIVPIAYAISDLIEGVAPDFLLDWVLGYLINPACFWLAYQFIGRNPDFRLARTWGWYLGFVAIFMGIEPQLWGYICAGKFTPEISYRSITPALFFTTTITWMLSPLALLVALPLARKLGLFWAEIPGHVRERRLFSKEWLWESGHAAQANAASQVGAGVSIRVILVGPFVLLMLVAVTSITYVGLHSSEEAANRLAKRLHQEVSENIDIKLDNYLDGTQNPDAPACPNCLDMMLRKLPIAEHGLAFVIDRYGRHVATSIDEQALALDPKPQGADIANAAVARAAILQLKQAAGPLSALQGSIDFSFHIVTAKPLAREVWLARATTYADRSGAIHWILVTAMPESYYLGAIRSGNSQSAMVYAIVLILSLALATILATMVANPIRHISRATRALAGNLSQRIPDSRVEELNSLAHSFSQMAARLQEIFANLRSEVEMRKQREQELEASRRQLEESKKRLRLAITGAKLGIWDWDVVADKLIWDEAVCRLYGIAPEQFGGTYKAWEGCLAPETLQQASADIVAALRGEREFVSEFAVCWADGSRHLLRGLAHTVRDPNGRAIRMVGINFDVTEQHRAEEELRQHRDHLEELVLERTESLSVAVALAESANRAKSAFLANMSHEIRTPISAILGLAHLLRQDELTITQADRLNKMDAAAKHLLSIINDILDLSKIEAGKLELERTDFQLRSLVEQLQSLVSEQTKAKGLALTIDVAGVPAWLNGDPTRLRQALLNYISNAIKFSERGVIAVRAQVLEDSSEGLLLRFEVRDNGIGIPVEKIGALFQTFEQVDASTTRNYGGTGLGLAITRRLAALMAGAVGVESELGKGSCFWFTARLQRGHVVAAAVDCTENALEELRQQHRNARVLLAEDNPVNREIGVEFLRRAGLVVDVACNGREAVDKAQSSRYDLILMDVQMPQMDGIEATRIIRTLPDSADTPILAMTANAFEEDRRACAEAGMNDFVAKPVDPKTLYSILRKWLRKASPVAATAPEIDVSL
jgi:PAS domain S-box-containing protein